MRLVKCATGGEGAADQADIRSRIAVLHDGQQQIAISCDNGPVGTAPVGYCKASL